MTVIRDGNKKHVDSDGFRRGGRVLEIIDDSIANMQLPKATVEKPYWWIATSMTAVSITEERAWQLKKIGGFRIHPNPGSPLAVRHIRSLSDKAIVADRKAKTK